MREVGGTARFLPAVAVPLAVAALAYGLWWISDRLVVIGPIDRATFGWAVVIPTWLAVPVAAGFAWRNLDSHDAVIAALVAGTAISGAAALLFWLAAAHPDCLAVRTPAQWILPSLIVGVVIGTGVAVSCLVSASLARDGHRWRSAVFGAGMQLIMVFVAILGAAAVLLAGPGCQRPPV